MTSEEVHNRFDIAHEALSKAYRLYRKTMPEWEETITDYLFGLLSDRLIEQETNNDS